MINFYDTNIGSGSGNFIEQFDYVKDDTKLSNTSVIIPFYQKHTEFEFSLNFNAKHFKKLKELIIVFDTPEDLEKYSYYLKRYDLPFVFFVNQEFHEWRNPCIPINFGILNSKGNYIIILSPETLILENSLEELLNHTNEESYAIGNVIFTTYKNLLKLNLININKFIFDRQAIRGKTFYYGPVPYGSICCTKKNLLNVGLYDTAFYNKGWGGEDNDIRDRLNAFGLIQNNVKQSNFIHPEDNYVRSKGGVKHLHLGTKINQPFDNFVSAELSSHKTFQPEIHHPLITNSETNIFHNNYPIILLAQCYNESHHIKEFLDSVYNFVDGIIILDDGSTDNSYDIFDVNIYKKIICKFKKIRQNTFDDLQNRNMLLSIYENMLNYIDNQWVLWLDMDERLGDSENTILGLRKMLLSNYFDGDVLSVSFFNMWNNNQYNRDYPLSFEGIQKRYKIFRKIEQLKPYKIESNKKLHFQLYPNSYKTTKFKYLPISVKHLGTSSKELRIKKYKDYKMYDKKQDQKSYEHFLQEKPRLINFTPNRSFFNFYRQIDIC